MHCLKHFQAIVFHFDRGFAKVYYARNRGTADTAPRVAVNRHVIHTTLIAFYDLISQTDTTVTKCDFNVNHLVSIFQARKQILNSSVARS